MTPMVANRPAPMSATERPIFTGPPPTSPVTLMDPEKACMKRSLARSSLRGPVRPKPLMEQ